ncbi:ABC transporter ATPase [Clostridium bornimense]|uniref:ABC transporter ATPase n=1 Tax=Clostridium bornimense TaxID=1216932 RepID=W6SK77_9CLOT|nr:ABC transporter ATP-binding protein [Clostridium bornimense]CDM70220.1 ABC transporter ATPase [Clostridium bornimense]
MENALEIKNLSKKYPEFTLDNINITLPAGCIMGFIGENGAGKSTTIKAILDLIEKDSGEITILGETNLSKNQRLKEHIGVVIDECSFPENLNAKEIDKVMKNCYKTWNRTKYMGYLDKFALSLKKPVKEYSRGMKMKLSIAVALSHDSKLLILDEATSGLDPIVRDEILDVFLDFIQDESHSIFISSHIISDLEKICDYITFIHNGKIILSDVKDDLLDKYTIIKCTEAEYSTIDKSAIIGRRKSRFGIEALALKEKISSGTITDKVNIEDIMLYFVKGEE